MNLDAGNTPAEHEPGDAQQDDRLEQPTETEPETGDVREGGDQADDKTDSKTGKADGKADDAAALKARARQWETRAKQNKSELDKLRAEQAALIDNIATALGLKPKADDDPKAVAEQLTSELTATRDELRQSRVELAVYRAAARHGGDPDALLDSRAFLRAVAGLDPDDEGFADAVADAIKAAVKANPKLAAQKASPPPRSSGEMPGAPGGNAKRPTGLAAAISSYYRR